MKMVSTFGLIVLFICAICSSSHLIKEVAGYGKRLPELVPELVIERLRAKLKVG